MPEPSIPQTLLQLRALLPAASMYNQVQPDWFPANRVKLLLEEDPAFTKSREFVKTWCEHYCPSVVRVCTDANEVRSAKKLRETFAHMTRGVPVIEQAALWWAPEQIYGTADLLAHSAWLNERFPGLMMPSEAAKPAPKLGDAGKRGHYVVVDFAARPVLEESKSKKDQQICAAQVRLDSYMLGQLQGVMPAAAYVITRDRVLQPFAVPIRSKVSEPLDSDLASLRDQFADIERDGAKCFALAS